MHITTWQKAKSAIQHRIDDEINGKIDDDQELWMQTRNGLNCVRWHFDYTKSGWCHWAIERKCEEDGEHVVEWIDKNWHKKRDRKMLNDVYAMQMKWKCLLFTYSIFAHENISKWNIFHFINIESFYDFRLSDIKRHICRLPYMCGMCCNLSLFVLSSI